MAGRMLKCSLWDETSMPEMKPKRAYNLIFPTLVISFMTYFHPC